MNGYIGNSSSFKPDFIKYFNIIKDCVASDCIPSSGSSTMYKSLSGDGANTSLGGEGQFVLSNGMTINIQNSDAISFGITITVDVNGHLKAPNIYGKDTFIFQLINDNLVPMGAPGTYYSASTYCNRSTHFPEQGFACAVNVMTDTNY